MDKRDRLTSTSRTEYPPSVRALMVAGLILLAIASAIAAVVNRDRIHWWTFALYGVLFAAYLAAEKMAHSPARSQGRRVHEPLRYLLSIAWWALIVGSPGAAALWPVAQTAVTVFGAVLMAAGSILRIWSVSTLGSCFSGHIETWPDQTVVRAGPYRILRHPGYAGNILQAIGLPLVVVAIGALPLAAVVIALFLRRMIWEDDWLAENLPGYRDYRKETRRLLPGIW
jgi:protein-S-isoprenylcysteine O-methyltransferase Ste14